jgi:hypothetical protein
MIDRLIIRPEAEADMTEAYAWYESRLEGLESRFIEEIDEEGERIVVIAVHHQSRDPETWEKRF